MVNKINYQKELDKILNNPEKVKDRPGLLLHSCCAPCSSYCLLYLREYFDITCLFYNPNITDENEYNKRFLELKRLIELVNAEAKEEGRKDICDNIRVIDGGFEASLFFEDVKGLENIPEGGERCRECFSLRLDKTAQMAAAEGFDYFTTSLTISPLKNEQTINRLGQLMAEKYSTSWLPSDFKKKGGYQESVRLSEKYGLYRQNFCGCVYSLRRDYQPDQTF